MYFLLIILLFINILPQEKESKPNEEFGLEKAVNLGKSINTSSGEFAPTISADGNTLIFESDREQDYIWKLYVSNKTDTGWTLPKRLENVNSNSWDGAPFLTYDQNYLLISSDRKGGQGDVDIWISERLSDHWAKPINFGPQINTSDYDGFASLSSDGSVLYFMRSAESDGECMNDNHYDIYSSQKQNNKWEEPQKLPYPINTEYCEEYPVILADGKTLIFSSNRPGGFGNYDLYKSEINEDGSWGEPMNLGSFINTPLEDQLVSIPASGDIMYFSTGEENRSDLFSVPIPTEVQPTKVITVAGTVRNAVNFEPLFAEISIVDIESDSSTTTIKSNQIDGKYIVILNAGRIYDVSVSAKDYTFLSTQFDLTSLEKYKEYQRDILLEPIKTGSKMILNNIYFEVDSYTLLDKSRYELNRVLKLMKENPSMVVEIDGHTDSTASEEYNFALSLKRATSVTDYLTKNGIENERLTAKGFGESQPIADNESEEGRQINRRVEFNILFVEKNE